MKKNYIAIVLDASGSMGHLSSTVRSSYAQQVKKIKEEAEKTKIKTYLSVVVFGGYVYDLFLDKVDVLNVDPNKLYYTTGGGTPLLQTFGRITESFEAVDAEERGKARKAKKKYDTSFLIITMTDGEENESTHPYKDVNYITSLIKTNQDKKNWTFAFNVPNQYNKKTLQTFGIPEGNITIWETTVLGLESLTEQTTSGFIQYFNARSVKGLCSVNNFYSGK